MRRLAAPVMLLVVACSDSATTTPDGGTGDAATTAPPETAGITWSPNVLTIPEGGTLEFFLGIESAPVADVTLALQTRDEAQGAASPASLVFTADNWTQQKVTLQAIQDDDTEGNRSLVLDVTVTSDDERYDALGSFPLTAVVEDDDEPGVVAEPVTLTMEEGGSATFSVRLESGPISNATVKLEVVENDVTVSPAELVFSGSDWDQPQIVTISSADDLEADGNQTVEVSLERVSSPNPAYDGLDPQDVTVVITDND